MSCLYASFTDKLACAMMDIPLLKLDHTDNMGVIKSCLKWATLSNCDLRGSSKLMMLLNICFQSFSCCILFLVVVDCSVIVYRCYSIFFLLPLF